MKPPFTEFANWSKQDRHHVQETPSKPHLYFHPLAPERWSDFEALFGDRGACGGCWCMVWRLKRSEWEAGKGEANRIAIKTIVEANDKPGILAYADGKPVGWCAVAPRETYVALERSRVLKPVDETPVWSVSCFFVAKEFRRHGVSVQLLRAAVEFVKAQGGTVVEGYPVVPYNEKMPAPFAWTGLLSAYEKAGFVEVERRSKTRPIMRYEIRPEFTSRGRSPTPRAREIPYEREA